MDIFSARPVLMTSANCAQTTPVWEWLVSWRMASTSRRLRWRGLASAVWASLQVSVLFFLCELLLFAACFACGAMLVSPSLRHPAQFIDLLAKIMTLSTSKIRNHTFQTTEYSSLQSTLVAQALETARTYLPVVSSVANLISELDVLLSFATAAALGNCFCELFFFLFFFRFMLWVTIHSYISVKLLNSHVLL